MIKIAILEDKKEDLDLLTAALNRYAKEMPEAAFRFDAFTNPMPFLNNYPSDYDIIFIDIHMPVMDGMRSAELVRRQDKNVDMVFVTNDASYATHGYQVEAADFIVKPIHYAAFSKTMERLLARRDSKKQFILLRSTDGIKRVLPADILYVEVNGHKVEYHMTDGSITELWGALKDQEALLLPHGFARCNHYCLVNLRHISDVKGTVLLIGEQEIFISRTKKKELMNALVEHYKNIV